MAKGEKTKRRRRWPWILLAILVLIGVAAYVTYAGGEREGPGTITGGSLADEVVERCFPGTVSRVGGAVADVTATSNGSSDSVRSLCGQPESSAIRCGR